MTVTIRPATAHDEPAIRAMAHSERLNPNGLDWPHFVVAVDGDAIVGIVQMRKHEDGSRELGTLVVRKDARGQAIAERMIDALLARETGQVFMITGAAYAEHYARWGFHPQPAAAAPRPVRQNYRIGSIAAAVFPLLKGQAPRRLAIYERKIAA